MPSLTILQSTRLGYRTFISFHGPKRVILVKKMIDFEIEFSAVLGRES